MDLRHSGSAEAAARALVPMRRVLICGHVSPDGDCIGSELGLARGLRALGKEVTCLLVRDEPIEYGLRFLPGAEELVAAERYEGDFDSFVTVDVPNLSRMGKAAAALHARAALTLTIDHHPSEGLMSQENYIDADAPSASLLVWKVLEAAGARRDAGTATCCYTGLNTDTGRFSFQNTTSEAFDLAAEMVHAGARPDEVAGNVYQNRSKASIALTCRALERIEYLNGGDAAFSYLRLSDFAETNGVKSDAEPIIDAVRSIRGVRVACMLREQDDCVRGSLRAKDGTDVSKVAAKLGGGGHKAAAGFTLHMGIDEARSLIRSELEALTAR